jgi:CheY-like chemotaxis protein
LPPDSPTREDIEQIEDAGSRAAALTAQLLAYARRQIIAPRTTDLNQVVAGMEGLLRRLLGEDIVLEIHYGWGLWSVRVDPGQLEQVILNFAVNARDAMSSGGTLTIETTNAPLLAGAAPELEPGAYVALMVRDTGVGMDEVTRTQIFEPFFTTKEQGKGTGLGLAVCYGIVKQADGHIVVETAPGTGATLQHPELRAPDPTGFETVLVVEDDASVRSLAVRTLRELGYTVLEASDGTVAQRVAAGYEQVIDLLLVDVVMPGLDGNAVAERLVTARPSLRVLYMTGYTDHPAVRRGVAEDRHALVSKPFAPTQLARAVRDALDGAAGHADGSDPITAHPAARLRTGPGAPEPS